MSETTIVAESWKVPPRVDRWFTLDCRTGKIAPVGCCHENRQKEDKDATFFVNSTGPQIGDLAHEEGSWIGYIWNGNKWAYLIGSTYHEEVELRYSGKRNFKDIIFKNHENGFSSVTTWQNSK